MLYYFYHLDYPYQPGAEDDAVREPNVHDVDFGIFRGFDASNPVIIKDEPSYSHRQYTESELYRHRAHCIHRQHLNPRHHRLPEHEACRRGHQACGPERAPNKPNLDIHTRLYAMAEMYDIPGLKTLAVQKFEYEAHLFWNTDDFLAAAQEAYTSTVASDRGLRDAVLEAFSSHRDCLNDPRFQQAVKNSELCFELMMKFRDRMY